MLCFEKTAVPARECPWTPGRDLWWADVIPTQPGECEPEWLDAEDPLFLLYTSGSTGNPKARHSAVLLIVSSSTQCARTSQTSALRSSGRHCQPPSCVSHDGHGHERAVLCDVAGRAAHDSWVHGRRHSNMPLCL